MDAIGTHAVHSISRHTEATHVEVLALVDELLAIGRAAEPGRSFQARPEPTVRTTR